ncbi:hypothetical protein EHS25_003224 [Saitozyma podzolica]|uniref:CRA domain-containing protein n=1 Tax=Saitozyma podzolica TaxID=1890683 RepID=A0A427Y8C8_9TREE|nr:hypothetical protein EHS25_003224 [Saitozyma podzolica]
MNGGSAAPTCLHDIILDYVSSAAYSSTARSLAQSSRPRRPGSTPVPDPGVTGNGAGYAREAGDAAIPLQDGKGDGGMDVDVDVDMESMTDGKGKGSGSGLSKMTAGTLEAGAGATEGGTGGIVLDEQKLASIEWRRAIINSILNGAIHRAEEALNAHFPSVLTETPGPGHGVLPSNGDGAISWTNGNSHSAPQSQDSALPSSSSSSPPIPSHLPQPYSAFQFPHSTSSSSSTVIFASNGSSALGASSSDHSLPVLHHSSHPAHVRLNLRIQSFIESFRQLAPSSPSSPSSSMGSLTSSMHNGGPSAAVPGGAGAAAGGGVTLTHALTAAQGLHAEAKKLGPEDRAVYLQEIKDVGALFAYTDPETSILKGFLEQGRRIVLAEQVNRAILRSEGLDPQSQLEHISRRVTALWALMADYNVDPRPPWTGADGQSKEQLAAFAKAIGRGGFRLRDYVAHSWA